MIRWLLRWWEQKRNPWHFVNHDEVGIPPLTRGPSADFVIFDEVVDMDPGWTARPNPSPSESIIEGMRRCIELDQLNEQYTPGHIEPLPINEEYEREIEERGRRIVRAFEGAFVYGKVSDDSLIAEIKRSMESKETARLTVADLEQVYRNEIRPAQDHLDAERRQAIIRWNERIEAVHALNDEALYVTREEWNELRGLYGWMIDGPPIHTAWHKDVDVQWFGIPIRVIDPEETP